VVFAGSITFMVYVLVIYPIRSKDCLAQSRRKLKHFCPASRFLIDGGTQWEQWIGRKKLESLAG